VKCTVYLIDMEQFKAVNEVYAEYFTDGPPARVAYGVAALPRGAQVEIDAIVEL
jgi:2-iminobutanoate/2-iminopropanoate deaminase